jgi:uncharacterized protein YcbX
MFDSVGTIESLWRYPVKSMRGEALPEAFLGFAGVFGDRVCAFRTTTAQPGFPYLTAREQEHMLLYSASFRDGGMSGPPNLSEAEALPPGVTPVYPDQARFAVAVRSPSGESYSVDDPRLAEMLRPEADQGTITLHRSDRAMTDCRPVSLFSVQTAERLAGEAGLPVDKRRFRANLYIDLRATTGYAENEFVGRKLRIGGKAVLMITDQDPRCKMITLDPDTAEPKPEVLRAVTRLHDNKAGVYGVVIVEGMVRSGDPIVPLD